MISKVGRSAEESNKSFYLAGAPSAKLESNGCWLDRGEQAAVSLVATHVRGGAILDIGVGRGRTVSLLTLLSDDYRAIDFSPTMVEQCRSLYPDRDVEVGDARDLTRFADGQFALVMFSFNGIDTVSHDHRAIVLSEICRVLAADGYFVYSTTNKNGPIFRDRPWRVVRTARPDVATLKRGLLWLIGFGLDVRGTTGRWVRWWRLRDEVDDHGSWAHGPLTGTGSGLVVHWTTTAATAEELDVAGMSLVALFDQLGHPLNAADQNHGPVFFHIVARRPPRDGLNLEP